MEGDFIKEKIILILIVLATLCTPTIAYTGSVDFPELFKYSDQKNTNLETALHSISSSFNQKDVPVTQELIAAMVATLEKEVESHGFLPREEDWDHGMGPGCSATKKGVSWCSENPYEGGVDYKGRGYIQLTLKSNYEKYCPDCVGTSTAELNVCGCKNKKNCTVADEAICPQVKALQPERAANIFASYYIKSPTGKNLVSLSNAESYWDVAYAINPDPTYDSDFKTLATDHLTLFRNNPDKTKTLLAWLNSGTSAASEASRTQTGTSPDNIPPEVQAFQVTPLSLTVDESFTIDYTVSDNDGSGLKQVELWRKDEQSNWEEIKKNEVSGENGPVSGSFMDSPSAPGKYWYGLHVVDNAGNWNDEKNSNTDNPSVSLEPIEVEAIEQDPNNAEAWNRKGDALYNQDKYDEAIKAYEEAIRLDPNYNEAWNNEGNVLYILGRYDEAIKAYEEAIRLDPNYNDAWSSKGIVLYILGRYDESLKASNKAIELNPDNAIAWGCKGANLYRLGRYDESIQASNKAIELNPNLAEIWGNKGTALYLLGRYDESLQASNKAIELKPNLLNVWVTKGFDLKNLGRTTESDAAFAKAKELGYTG